MVEGCATPWQLTMNRSMATTVVGAATAAAASLVENCSTDDFDNNTYYIRTFIDEVMKGKYDEQCPSETLIILACYYQLNTSITYPVRE